MYEEGAFFMIQGGYWGRILWIDLTNGKTDVVTFDDAYARKYLGGVGFGAQILSEKVTKHTNPLGPGNVLVFATGPYQADGCRQAPARQQVIQGCKFESAAPPYARACL